MQETHIIRLMKYLRSYETASTMGFLLSMEKSLDWLQCDVNIYVIPLFGSMCLA